MNLKLKAKLLLGALLMGAVTQTTALCLKGYDDFIPEDESTEEHINLPLYTVRDAEIIYRDLKAIEPAKRREYLEEIIRRGNENYVNRMVLCAEHMRGVYSEFLCKSIPLVFNNRDEKGNNLLHFAACEGRLDIFMDIKSVLSYRGVGLKDDYNTMMDMQNCNGYTPLHLAVASGNIELVKYIVEDLFIRKNDYANCELKNSDALSIRSKNGFTPLEMARYLGDLASDKVIKNTFARMGDVLELTPVVLAIVRKCDGTNCGVGKPVLCDEDVAKLKSFLNSDIANFRVSEHLSLLRWALLWQNEDLFNHLKSLGASDESCPYYTVVESDTDKYLYADDMRDSDFEGDMLQ